MRRKNGIDKNRFDSIKKTETNSFLVVASLLVMSSLDNVQANSKILKRILKKWRGIVLAHNSSREYSIDQINLPRELCQRI